MNARDAFPANCHPWTDLYTEKLTLDIGKIIRLEQPDQLRDLRLMLAYACEDCFKTFRFVGGAASEGKKRTWREKAIKDAKRLKVTLNKSEDNHAAFVQKTSRRVFPNSVTTNLTEKLLNNLEEFISLAEDTAKESANSKSPPAVEEQSKTQHSQYLQYVVDQMTAVFIHFRSAKAVKRSNDGKETYGEFPEFVRTASIPALTVFYNGFAEDRNRYENLNVQIQEAVRKAKFLHE